MELDMSSKYVKKVKSYVEDQVEKYKVKTLPEMKP